MKRLFLLAIVTLMATGCGGFVGTSDEGFGQQCPSWAGYETECDVRIWKAGIGAEEVAVDMTDWEMMRFTTVGEEVLIDEDTNISVYTDYGQKIDHASTRLKAGSYLVQKVDLSQPASFRFIGPQSDVVVHISVEFVRPASQEG